MTAIVELDPISAESMRGVVGPDPVVLPDLEALRRHLDDAMWEDVIVLGASVDQQLAFELAERLRVSRPSVGVVLVRRRIDTTLLTEALRAGVREVVVDRDLPSLTAAVMRAHTVADAMREQVGGGDAIAREHARGRVVTVFSAKGGCGKTTLATNLATLVAESGRKVALLDLDLSFGDVAIALQLFPTHTMSDAVPLEHSLDTAAVRALLTPHRSGLQVLAAPLEPAGADKVSSDLVVRVIDILAEEFDLVVIDTPPALEDHVLAAFDRSDIVALLATLDIPALKNLKLTIETLDLISFPREKMRIVLNRADSKVGLALGEVEKTLRMPISVQIPSSRDVPASTNRGVALVSEEPRHPVSVAIRGFAEQQVFGGGVAAAAIPSDLRADRRGGLLRRKRGSA